MNRRSFFQTLAGLLAAAAAMPRKLVAAPKPTAKPCLPVWEPSQPLLVCGATGEAMEVPPPEMVIYWVTGNFKWRGPWRFGPVYQKNDIVELGGKLMINTGSASPEEQWVIIGHEYPAWGFENKV